MKEIELSQELQVNSPVPHKIYADNVEAEALRQFEDCLRMEGCVQGALMADCHTGYVAPIGSVLKFKDQISPALVGYDIGCGVISAELNITAAEIDLDKLKMSILRSVPIGFNRHKKVSKETTKYISNLLEDMYDIID